METTNVRRRILLGFLLTISVLATCPLMAYQTCTQAKAKHGVVCRAAGVKCSPVTDGSGDSGKCTTEGSQADGQTCECKAASGKQDYTLAVSPASLTIVQGSIGNSTIFVEPLNGFNSSVVNLTASGMPSGWGWPADDSPARSDGRGG